MQAPKPNIAPPKCRSLQDSDVNGVPNQYFYYTAPMSRLPTSKPMAQRCFSADWSRPLARWGETLIEEKATRPGMHFESPYRFNAKELDEETGLYYYGARYYNPMVSVWLGVDPLYYHPNQVDKSPYAYVWNNPVNLVDPDGRCPDCPDASTAKEGDIANPHGQREYVFANGEWTGIGGTLNEVTVTADGGAYDAQLYSHQSSNGNGEMGGFVVGYRDGGSDYSIRGFNLRHTYNNNEASIEVSGLNARIEGNIGGLNSTLNADVFHARASIINTPTRKALDVGAYAAKAETSISFFGFGITLGGSFGSAHAGFDVGTQQRSDGSVKMGASGHFGFGAGIKIGVSYDSRRMNNFGR
jgi:RHS repeat-associated protein